MPRLTGCERKMRESSGLETRELGVGVLVEVAASPLPPARLSRGAL